MLKSGDTLIVAGKGHEEGQTIGERDAAVLRSCRGAQGIGGAEILSWLWTTEDMIAAMAGRPVRHAARRHYRHFHRQPLD